MGGGKAGRATNRIVIGSLLIHHVAGFIGGGMGLRTST